MFWTSLFVAGAALEIRGGENAELVLGQATIRATCGDFSRSPAVKMVEPYGAGVRATLSHVQLACADLPMSVPCVGWVGYPALFYCGFSQAAGESISPPVRAQVRTEAHESVVYLECPTPDGIARGTNATVRVYHYAQTAASQSFATDATLFPYVGLYGGDRVDIPFFSPSLPPSAPPSPPPSAPIAVPLTFVDAWQGSSNVGNGDARYWDQHPRDLDADDDFPACLIDGDHSTNCGAKNDRLFALQFNCKGVVTQGTLHVCGAGKHLYELVSWGWSADGTTFTPEGCFAETTGGGSDAASGACGDWLTDANAVRTGKANENQSPERDHPDSPGNFCISVQGYADEGSIEYAALTWGWGDTGPIEAWWSQDARIICD